MEMLWNRAISNLGYLCLFGVQRWNAFPGSLFGGKFKKLKIKYSICAISQRFVYLGNMKVNNKSV